MSPEVVISHVVNDKKEDKRNRNKLRFVACSDHENKWEAEDNGDHLKFGSDKSSLISVWKSYVLAVPVELDQSHEHQDHQKSARKLNILLKMDTYSIRKITKNDKILSIKS